MTLSFSYADVVGRVSAYNASGRSESAAFLAWFLENYYRIDKDDAIDLICDQRGDKGIDGIFINDHEGTIDIFQSKLSQKDNSTIGDTALKEFSGTLNQLQSEDSLDKLVASSPTSDVARLIQRLNIKAKIKSYKIRGIFVSNIDIDHNGLEYLSHIDNMLFIGRQYLEEKYISSSRAPSSETPHKFDISGYDAATYTVDRDVKTIITSVQARELVKMNGIADQSLFALNVRGTLGGTQVNKDIVKSIRNSSNHKKFPLFHNGITIVCKKFTHEDNSVIIENYYVVNGCQSLSSLYENESYLTDDLRILTKIIQTSEDSDLSKIITAYSNNQNGVKARDFKSNNPIQIRLQNEFKSLYGNEYAYEIKRGESSGLTAISNEDAGLHLMAFDLKEPWSTHRKYQIFDDKYSEIFGGPKVSSDRIVMLTNIMSVIIDGMGKIENELVRKYNLTKYIILYITRMLLESDEVGREIISDPGKYVRESRDREKFKELIEKVVNTVIIDFNAEVVDLGETFDYRGSMRDSEWVKKISSEIISTYKKLVDRGRIDSISRDWESVNIRE